MSITWTKLYFMSRFLSSPITQVYLKRQYVYITKMRTLLATISILIRNGQIMYYEIKHWIMLMSCNFLEESRPFLFISFLIVALSCLDWKISHLLVLQHYWKQKSTRKLIWKPLLMRFGNLRGPHKKLNYWVFAWTKSMSFFSYSYDLVNQRAVRWMISECWCVILESTLAPRSFIFLVDKLKKKCASKDKQGFYNI